MVPRRYVPVVLIVVATAVVGCTNQSSDSQQAPADSTTKASPRGPARSGAGSSQARRPRPSETQTASDAQTNIAVPCSQAETIASRTPGVASIEGTPVFLYPRKLHTPLTTLEKGAAVALLGNDGEWYQVEFPDDRYGPRVGFVHCSGITVAGPTPRTSEPSASASQRPQPATGVYPGTRSLGSPAQVVQPKTPAVATQVENVSGYAEWKRDGYFIVEGQRVRWDSRTRFRLGRLASVDAVPLGYEMNVRGVREPGGILLATQLEAKPNGLALLESDVQRASDGLETAWVRDGRMYELVSGVRSEVGPVLDSGAEVDRVRRVLSRVTPPYVNAAALRVHVVKTDEWNARAMPNGSIWVNTRLLNDLSDDELAIVVGHELAHYTHEHGRRNARNTLLVQLAAETAKLGIQRIESAKAGAAADIGAWLSLSAWQKGYNRTLEDQADRVGLRYAYEGGFDVSVAPRLWLRTIEEFGQPNRVSNFFFGGHSRSSDRSVKLESELRLNYPGAVGR